MLIGVRGIWLIGVRGKIPYIADRSEGYMLIGVRVYADRSEGYYMLIGVRVYADRSGRI